MNFGKLKAALKGLINRRDLTDALAGDFINRAIDEAQRVVCIAPNEALLIADDWTDGNNAILIPGNYLELVEIFTDERVLQNVDKTRYLHTGTAGSPSVYTKVGPNWLIKPAPALGQRVYVQYHGADAWLQGDSESNMWTKGAFNAALYGAAALAADYFQMEDQYVQRFQGKANALITSIQQQDYDDRWSGTTSMGRIADRGEY